MGCAASASNAPHKQFQAQRQLSLKKPKRKMKAIDNRFKSIEIRDAPSALIESREKSPKDVQLIQSALNRHFLFNSLSPEQKKLVISEMLHYTLNSNSVIFEQDMPGNNFFIISSGKVEVLINSKQKNILRTGDSFGELALMHGTLRNATVQTLTATELWSLDRKTFKKVVHSINSLVYKENKSFIEGVGLFQMLTEEQQDFLLGSLNTQQFVAGFTIVNEGDPGKLFFIIKQGSVSVIKNGTEIRQMTKGDYFGEQALLYDGNRTASVLTLTPTVCLSVAAESLLLALGSNLQSVIYKNSLKIALEKNAVLRKLSNSQIARVVEAVEVRSFEAGDVVCEAKKKVLNVVVKGSVKCGGKVFGLFDCIEAEKFCFGGDCEEMVAEEDSDVGQVKGKVFEEVIGGEFKDVVLENEVVNTLRSVAILTSMNQEDLEKVTKVMKIVKYDPDTTIFEENDEAEYFFIIREGALDVYKDSTFLRTLYKLDYFGERSLLFNSPRSATVKSRSLVELCTITREAFLGLFPETVKKNLLKRIELQDNTIQLSDLVIIKLIGKGMFGNVFLTAHKLRKTFYALKTVSREKIQAYTLQPNLVLERKVLYLIEHQMIMKLVKTFKDIHRVYFLLEHVAGTDLFEVLRKLNILNEPDSRFYAACIVIILEHLHSKNIVYRDLKPENIVIDSEGYPKLIDFGISKVLNGRTFSLVGTPHYMPPEVIEGKGYGTTADYWSLGIMVYEFVCGAVPFGDDDDEPYLIYEKVLEHNLMFPPWVENLNTCKNVIEQLLNKNPGLRLGGNVKNLKEHSWFSMVNWEKMMKKQVKPPYLPSMDEIGDEVEKVISEGRDLNAVVLEEENKDLILNRRPSFLQVDENWDEEF